MYTVDFDKMTLKEKILQTFIVSIREINKHGGPQEFFKKYKVGGMYYSKSQDPNIENRTETSLPTHPKHLAECNKRYSGLGNMCNGKTFSGNRNGNKR